MPIKLKKKKKKKLFSWHYTLSSRDLQGHRRRERLVRSYSCEKRTGWTYHGQGVPE